MEENIIHHVELGRSDLWRRILPFLQNQIGRSYGGGYCPSFRTRQVRAMEENIVRTVELGRFGAIEENIVPHLELGRSELWMRILSVLQNQVGRSYGGDYYPPCKTRQVWSYEGEYYPSCRTRQDEAMVENIICPVELGYRSMLQLSATKPTLPVKGIYVRQNVQNSLVSVF